MTKKNILAPLAAYRRSILTGFAAFALILFACSDDNGGDPQPPSFYACSGDDAPPSQPSFYALSNDYDSSKECVTNPHQTFNPNLYECKPNINPYAIYLKGGVKDAGGNEYNAVLIGTQVWMAENLNLATDRNGNGTDSNGVGRCFEDKCANCKKFGRMYVITKYGTDPDLEGGEIRCPDGWRLPSSEDLTALLKYIDPTHKEGSVWTGRGDNNAGPFLKARSSWPEDYDGTDGNGTDDYGFNALPGGYCGTGCGIYEKGGSPEFAIPGEPTWSILYPPVGGAAATSSSRANSSIFWWTTSKGEPVPLAVTWRISSGVIVDDAFQSYNNSRFYARCMKEAQL
jgi:uncharacterized protein (TIGR02145 family)